MGHSSGLFRTGHSGDFRSIEVDFLYLNHTFLLTLKSVLEAVEPFCAFNNKMVSNRQFQEKNKS
jgi:hypothetical protein